MNFVSYFNGTLSDFVTFQFIIFKYENQSLNSRECKQDSIQMKTVKQKINQTIIRYTGHMARCPCKPKFTNLNFYEHKAKISSTD